MPPNGFCSEKGLLLFFFFFFFGRVQALRRAWCIFFSGHLLLLDTGRYIVIVLMSNTSLLVPWGIYTEEVVCRYLTKGRPIGMRTCRTSCSGMMAPITPDRTTEVRGGHHGLATRPHLLASWRMTDQRAPANTRGSTNWTNGRASAGYVHVYCCIVHIVLVFVRQITGKTGKLFCL